ncbi:E2 [Canis familiaris papillomavirus 5]|uniref:Regulatory protein E2 n=1 Tax=Canis familiaris papillomavirus 5 TaxID=658422 RepID=C8YJK8_9PAPI|nr:E2 [Canis familiaris papillomavirus 5]
MESLTKRLGAIQDALLTIYEEGSDRLSDQVQHWNLLRKENVLLHYAKKAGILRLGLQPVPALRVSAEKAKQAIGMQLVLQSLQNSAYATEQWTLQDTSYERWMAEPSSCLKKGATYVEVYFDGDRANSMQYTMWHHVYFTDWTDTWQKTRSHVTSDGLWFWDNGERRYYVRFEDEAKKYATTGKWDVMFNNEPICPLESVTSTTPSTNLGAKTSVPVDWEPRRVAGGGGTAGPTGQGNWRAPQRDTWQAADSTETPSFTAPEVTQAEEEQVPCEEAPGVGGGLAVSGSLCSDPAVSESCRDPRGLLVSEYTGVSSGAEPLSRCVSPESGSGQPGTLQAPAAPEPGLGHFPAASAANTPAPAGPEANPAAAEGGPREGAEAGFQGRFPAASRPRRRPRQILREAGDSSTSVIVLSGPSNVLKCFRYRAKQMHKGCFCMISTTWYWAGDGSERIGNARILVTFSSNSQRAEFLDRVRLPSSVTLLDSIHTF